MSSMLSWEVYLADKVFEIRFRKFENLVSTNPRRKEESSFNCDKFLI